MTANGAQVEDDSAADGGKKRPSIAAGKLVFTVNQVGCGHGGRTAIAIHYASAGKAKVKLFVNGEDYSFVNTPATGAGNSYTSQAFLTVPLALGSTNTIKLVGGHGEVNVDYITVTPLD